MHYRGGPNTMWAHRRGGRRVGGEHILPRSDYEAASGAEAHLVPEAYAAEFGPAPEPGSGRDRVNWTLDADLVSALRTRAAETGIPVSRLVDDALRSAGYR
ncbi:MAG: ribbon-helix-helix domain-containing protein [Bacillota bacterium]